MAKKRIRRFFGFLGRQTFHGTLNTRLISGQSRALRRMWERSAPTLESMRETTEPLGPMGRGFVWIGGGLAVGASLSYFVYSMIILFGGGGLPALIASLAGLALSGLAVFYYVIAIASLRGKLSNNHPVMVPAKRLAESGLRMYASATRNHIKYQLLSTDAEGDDEPKVTVLPPEQAAGKK